jgi:hypothetical protein
VSFSVSVCLSVLTMSFLAPCADSVHPPGMLTCHAVLLSLRESVCHFIPKVSSSMARTIAAPSFWCDKNSYESHGMFSTETIPSPMAKPWHRFPHKNWVEKSQ